MKCIVVFNPAPGADRAGEAISADETCVRWRTPKSLMVPRAEGGLTAGVKPVAALDLPCRCFPQVAASLSKFAGA